MVKDHLLDHYSEAELLSQSFRIYTTLDPELEHAATEAISIGVANVDKLLARRYAADRKKGQPAMAQVAMIVLDPHTGEIRAVVGRARLRAEPAQSHSGAAAARVGVQAVRLCRGF